MLNKRFLLVISYLLVSKISYSSVRDVENYIGKSKNVVKNDSIVNHFKFPKKKVIHQISNHDEVDKTFEIYRNSFELFIKLPCSTEKIKIYYEYFLNPIEKRNIV